MKIAVINYGMGNISSVRRSLEEVGGDVVIANHPSDLDSVEKIVLPGVGSFAEGIANLESEGWVAVLQDAATNKQKPVLGICLGMQMLATFGHEGGLTKGLNLISGEVKKLSSLGCNQRIPHVGWNEVKYKKECPIFNEIAESTDFYFVHSYAFVPNDLNHLVAVVNYGGEFAAVVNHKNIFGCQFHPEKSSKAGLQILKNFMEYSAC